MRKNGQELKRYISTEGRMRDAWRSWSLCGMSVPASHCAQSLDQIDMPTHYFVNIWADTLFHNSQPLISILCVYYINQLSVVVITAVLII